MKVEGHDPIWAIADEDMDRDTAQKTSSVHFLRFELDPKMRAAVCAGSPVSVGIEHKHYNESVSPLPSGTRESLANDLDC